MKKILSLFFLLAFGVNSMIPPTALAQSFELPKPGAMIALSPAFTPAYLKGLVIHPDDPFKFDFIIDRGDILLDLFQKQEEYTKLIKYFLAALAVPDEQQWVNLSPYEKNRIIPETFGLTVMGRDLLAEDYMLKQITASMIYPEEAIGKEFWRRVYAEADKRYGSTNMPVNTFNKVWIIPDKATVYEKGNTVYILENHLKVMLEEDYLSLSKHQRQAAAHALGSQIVREVVLPALEKEVNEGKNFSPLRQVYSGMLLATWYKRTLKESILGKLYANKGKVKGVDQDPRNNQKIYDQYLKAFKKGVFNMIKEDTNQLTRQTIPRKYFSGGIHGYIDTPFNYNKAMSAQARKLGAKVDDFAEVEVLQPANEDQKTAAMLTVGEEITPYNRYLLGKSLRSVAAPMYQELEDFEIVLTPHVPKRHAKTGIYTFELREKAIDRFVTVFEMTIGDNETIALNIIKNSEFRSLIDIIVKIIRGKSDLARQEPDFIRDALRAVADRVGNPEAAVHLGQRELTPASTLLAELMSRPGSPFNFPAQDEDISAQAVQVLGELELLPQGIVGRREAIDALNKFIEYLGQYTGQAVPVEAGRVLKIWLASASFALKAKRDGLINDQSLEEHLLEISPLLLSDEAMLGSGQKIIAVSVLGVMASVVPNGLSRNVVAYQSIRALKDRSKTIKLSLDVSISFIPGDKPKQYIVTSPKEYQTIDKLESALKGHKEIPGYDGLMKALKDRNNVKFRFLGQNNKTLILVDRAMHNFNSAPLGGINMDSANLAMLIKRDGQGMPLPVSQQNLDKIHLNGLVPHILSIRSAADLSIFSR